MSAAADGRIAVPRLRLHRPRRSIRLRLTILYGGLFLFSGAALLAITYVLVGRQYQGSLFVKTATRSGGFVVSGTSHGGSASAGALGGGASGTVTIGSNGLPKLGVIPPGSVLQGSPTPEFLAAQAENQSHAALGALLAQSSIALAIMALISVWLGWLVAGRVLRPLRTITDAAREISAHDLHRRLGLDGPDDEFQRLGNTFDGLLARLEGSFEAQKRFVANASHELRTPLTLQRALVQVALADPAADTDALREMGRDVLAAGERQEQLIEALLTLSRSQTGLDRREPIDLAAVAGGILHTVDPGGLTIESTLEPAGTTGDPHLVERLVANLIGNALRHNVPGGRVAVATRTVAGRAVLAVTNTGPVIPPGEIDRLFQPFQRLHAERTESGEGAGLGLSIVDAIANAHDATVTARAQPGGGLDIEVGFPVDQ